MLFLATELPAPTVDTKKLATTFDKLGKLVAELGDCAGGDRAGNRGTAGKRLEAAERLIAGLRRQCNAIAGQDQELSRLATIVRTAVDAIITIDERGIIESSNPATERLFGYSAAELLGRNVKMLMPQPYQREHDTYLRAYLKTGQAKIIGIGREVTGLRKDGTTFSMSLSVSEVLLAERRLFTGIIHDLSKRRLLEREILEVSANEQRRIGQDLHDGLCQDLVGIALGADMVARQLTARGTVEARAVEQLAASIREAAGQARRLSHGLNPVNLNAGGLPIALEALAGKISESFHVRCAVEWDQKAQVTDDATATHLYRISQEAISNAIKHGKASNIEVSLRCEAGRLVLSVEDNGVGLAPDRMSKRRTQHGHNTAWPPDGRSPGIGLQGMRYRANLMGGTFEVTPGRVAGTRVTCSVPHSSRR